MPKSKSGKSRRSKSSKGSKRSKKSKGHKKKKDDEPDSEAEDERDTESVKERKRKKRKKGSKGSKDSGGKDKGSDASEGSKKKKRRRKPKIEGVPDEEGGPVPEGDGAESDAGSIASEAEKTPSHRSDKSASASAVTNTASGGGGGGLEDGIAEIHFRGMYRKWSGVRDYSSLLNPVYKAFQRFWPWPPKKGMFFTSGYYYDWDDGEGDLRDNELMIHNIPPGTPESEIKKEFPNATKITLNPDGTAKVEFDTPAAATTAYNNSRLVKLGNRRLKWIRPDELYVLSVPPNGVNADDILGDFPDGQATGVTFEDGPDGNLIGTVKFRTPQDADKAYEDGNPYKKLGNHQLGYTSSNNPIKLTNIPPGISDDDLKKKFPTAKKVENKGNGTAKIYFENDGDASQAYDDSDMVKLGKPKLGWLRPEELYIYDVPKDVKESDLLKEFPKAKRIKFQNGEGGQRIATVVFPNEDEQKKAYDDSDWTKLGPQKLKFGGLSGKKKKPKDKGDGEGGGRGNLQLSNVPQGTSEGDIKKKFPNATGVKIEKGTGNVKVQFKNSGDMNQAYEDSDMVKLGKPKLGWIRPEELYVEGIPGNVGEAELKQQFPEAKRINFLNGEGGKRIAQVVFPNEESQKKGYEDSDYEKVGPQKLKYTRPAKPASSNAADQSDADMLAKWELAAKGFSNISNLFSGILLVNGLPPHIKATDLIKLLPGATSVDFTKGKKGQAHVIFNDPSKAAHAFGVAKNIEFDGHKITVHILKSGGGKSGGKKKGSGKGSSRSSSGKSKK